MAVASMMVGIDRCYWELWALKNPLEKIPEY